MLLSDVELDSLKVENLLNPLMLKRVAITCYSSLMEFDGRQKWNDDKMLKEEVFARKNFFPSCLGLEKVFLGKTILQSPFDERLYKIRKYNKTLFTK